MRTRTISQADNAPSSNYKSESRFRDKSSSKGDKGDLIRKKYFD